MRFLKISFWRVFQIDCVRTYKLLDFPVIVFIYFIHGDFITLLFLEAVALSWDELLTSKDVKLLTKKIYFIVTN